MRPVSSYTCLYYKSAIDVMWIFIFCVMNDRIWSTDGQIGLNVHTSTIIHAIIFGVRFWETLPPSGRKVWACR